MTRDTGFGMSECSSSCGHNWAFIPLWHTAEDHPGAITLRHLIDRNILYLAIVAAEADGCTTNGTYESWPTGEMLLQWDEERHQRYWTAPSGPEDFFYEDGTIIKRASESSWEQITPWRSVDFECHCALLEVRERVCFQGESFEAYLQWCWRSYEPVSMADPKPSRERPEQRIMVEEEKVASQLYEIRMQDSAFVKAFFNTQTPALGDTDEDSDHLDAQSSQKSSTPIVEASTVPEQLLTGSSHKLSAHLANLARAEITDKTTGTDDTANITITGLAILPTDMSSVAEIATWWMNKDHGPIPKRSKAAEPQDPDDAGSSTSVSASNSSESSSGGSDPSVSTILDQTQHDTSSQHRERSNDAADGEVLG
ncbi:hypothetical protein EJ04DRAFT_563369 [Polyplosphaeria fusca]|uniref:Uncharacterized protein n=1 Tax=Polyplosphaeria fusca TaxID=682080 RepID=A0A9P4R2H0_9PLEO|nr:hypothetical protein EJ04DRAFT_563369 [Polyplosphaeria fusca]